MGMHGRMGGKGKHDRCMGMHGHAWEARESMIDALGCMRTHGDACGCMGMHGNAWECMGRRWDQKI